MSPAQIGTYSSSDSVTIARALTTNNIQLSVSNAKSLGARIPVTTSLAEIASIASGLSLTNIKNSNTLQLASSVKSMDLNNMNSFQKAYITTIVNELKLINFLKSKISYI